MIVRDTKELMADDLPDDDGARPGPSTDPNYVYSTDYETDAEVDNVLDQLDDEEEGSEDDFVESEDEGFGSQEKEEREEKVEPSYAEEILNAREQVKFEEEKPVKKEPKVEEEEVVVVKKERKPKEDFRGTKSAAVARQRLAYRQNKIAILKVDCGKCPWEHTIMKFAHDLTELDLPNVVRYIEGAENVAAYMLGIGREECIAQQYHPLEFTSKDHEKEMELRRAERRLKEEKRRKMERRQKKEFAKISKTLKYKRQMIESQSMESVHRAVLPPIETMSDRSSSRASSEASMSIIDENYRSTTKSATLSTSRLEEENARKREINERLDKIIQEIDKPSRASFFSERSAKSRSRETTAKTITGKPYPLETYAENETIIEDTFEGPGLSEDEDEMPIEHRSPLKSAFYRDHRDRMSAATHATGMTYLTSYTEASRRTAKTSARTYASSNATTLLPRPVTVVFKGIRDSPPKPTTAEKEMPPKKRPKNRKSKAKGQTAAYTSRTGKSKKSATSTKTRKSQKERRVAIVREDCNKCEFDAKTMKYEEDLTDYERRKIERVIDRTKDNINDSEL
ncbi:hypothetical protein FSP39_025365 [Pinctada imbricata]|uniref:Uncharacterized protein n=1 Tax=Pinctada imbricata TaxID=66713 RepID=A0AA88YRB3_PINIB|nr:hypothetical protein FSP39_025365 [Pinctada imbricata]